MDDLRLSFLGGFYITRAGIPVNSFESDKDRFLLAYLAVENDRAHRRESLSALFWPDMPKKRAHHSLSQALYTLKKSLRISEGDSIFVTTPQAVCFQTEQVGLDIQEFDQLLQASNHHPHHATGICPVCLERLVQAATLYRGDFLTGLTLPGCEAIGEWLLIQQESYRHKMIRVSGQLSSWYEATGDFEQALAYAMRQIALDPLDEAAHRQVMRLLAHQGKRLEALAHFDTCQKLLAEELGVPPSAETVQLCQQIKQQAESEPARFAVNHNLPAPLTRMVGRQDELKHLRQMLYDPACRLVTVTGPGGSGKTCLALEAGRSLASAFIDGVYLVELDTQQSSQELLPAIARSVGLSLQPNQIYTRSRSVLEQICDFLQDQRVLLILDGFEGLIPEAEQVASLLRKLPGLTVLATSRVRLNLTLEHILPLEGLAYPEQADTGDLDSYSAVQLFNDTARRIDPDFELGEHNRQAVAELCRTIQGIPLCILLSAVWVRILSPDHILQEIHRNLDFLSVDWHDLPDRQRSLAATFDHSWRLLKPTASTAFLRLSVLRGAFTLNRAQQVSWVSVETVKSLVDQSLLQRAGPDRFRMHDLLRQYALEKLAASPDEATKIHLRHSQIFLQALADLEMDLKSANQLTALAEIDQEYTDLLAAWQWAAANHQVELLEKAVEPLWYYYILHSLQSEGIELFQMTFQQLETEGLTRANRRLWVRLGIWLTGLLPPILGIEQAWKIYNRIEACMNAWESTMAEMPREKALLRLIRGDLILYSGGSRLMALDQYQEGLALMSTVEDPWGISLALLKIAIGHDQSGNIADSGRFAAQALAIQRSRGDPNLLWGILANLGYSLMLQGKYQAAWPVVQEQVANLRRTKNHKTEALINEHLGIVLFYSGQYDQARELFEAALVAYAQPEDIGNRLFIRLILASICQQTGDYQAVLNDTALSDEAVGIYEHYRSYYYQAGIYLLSSSWDLAEKLFNRHLELVRALPRLDMVGLALAPLGYIAYRRGNLTQALDYEEQALENGCKQGFFWVFVLALSVLALMLAEAGDIEQALALYATVMTHPCASNSRWMEDLFGKHLATLSAGLTLSEIAEAQACGRERSLSAVGHEYLDRLRASPGMRDELLQKSSSEL